MKQLLDIVASGRSLTREEAQRAFAIMMDGDATPTQIGAFLMGLRVRGETVDEIVGAVDVMRERMTRVVAPFGAVDIVGTGGDGSGSYNVSTCAAIVAAGAGAVVAKHGNRALSSRSGAADTLEALGVDLSLDPAGISRCIAEVGLGFMFAPNHHAAMRYVGPSRVELGTRTIFNLLGPLANPASVKRQVVGVFARAWVEPIAHVLASLGVTRAWVVHGDGLDELTVTGPTFVAEVEGKDVTTREISPSDAGLACHEARALKGGDAAHNAKALQRVLAGEAGAYRDVVLLNAAAALVVAEIATNLPDGVEKAAAAIDGGHASSVLSRLVDLSGSEAAA